MLLRPTFYADAGALTVVDAVAVVTVGVVVGGDAAHGGTTESQGGCWDGYAQTGEDYSLQSGAQITAIRAMIKAMAGI